MEERPIKKGHIHAGSSRMGKSFPNREAEKAGIIDRGNHGYKEK